MRLLFGTDARQPTPDPGARQPTPDPGARQPTPDPADDDPQPGRAAGANRFDEAVDDWWERRLRGRPALDRVFYAASEAANHSILWHCLGAAQAAARRSARPAAELSFALGLESALVNGGVKSLFGRGRPEHPGPRPHALRQPLTSSFPSGHASAAMVAAALLSRKSRLAPLWYGLGLLVALSRVHTRIHHATDVAAGIGAGVALGAAARRLLSRQPR